MGSRLALLPGAIIRDTLFCGWRCGCCCAVDELPICCREGEGMRFRTAYGGYLR